MILNFNYYIFQVIKQVIIFQYNYDWSEYSLPYLSLYSSKVSPNFRYWPQFIVSYKWELENIQSINNFYIAQVKSSKIIKIFLISMGSFILFLSTIIYIYLKILRKIIIN